MTLDGILGSPTDPVLTSWRLSLSLIYLSLNGGIINIPRAVLKFKQDSQVHTDARNHLE